MPKGAPQQVLHPSGAETVTGQSPVFPFKGTQAVFVLDVTAAAGTTPTLDVTIEEFDEASGKYSVIDTFPQQIAAATVRRTLAVPFGDKIRAVWTIGGAGPSFTFSLSATEA